MVLWILDIMEEINKYWCIYSGTKLTYPGEGDESGTRLASDVIFVIRESSHDHFRRDGNDLIYDINLDLPHFLETNQIKATVPLIEGGIYRKSLNIE